MFCSYSDLLSVHLPVCVEKHFSFEFAQEAPCSAVCNLETMTTGSVIQFMFEGMLATARQMSLAKLKQQLHPPFFCSAQALRRANSVTEALGRDSVY